MNDNSFALPSNWYSAALRIALSVFFFFSFATKIYYLEPVEISLVETRLFSWPIASLLSRIVVGLELLISVTFLFNIVRKFTFYTSVCMMVIFSIFLLFKLLMHGNTGDCGCFGDFIELSPAFSLAKNIPIIALILAWHFYSKEEWEIFPGIITGILLISCLGLPFYMNSPYLEERENTALHQTDYPLDVTTLGPMRFSDSTLPNLQQGEYILAFLSLRCDHCIQAARKLRLFQEEYALPPIYAVYIGSQELVDAFQKESHSKFPHHVYTSKKLLQVTGPEFPLIMYVQNGIVKAKWSKPDQANMAKWFKPQK
ncbi:MAG: hypothetical protein MUF42_11085 [Cytophagaceae bacterium]|jgi:hypothetical protein|nr:hypothetical protein [Cytophagaceae bacterium]